MPDLLLELLSEEIPARMQARAAEDLRRLVTDALVERGFLYEGAVAFATPRRLVLHVAGLPAKGQDLREERKGPRVGAPEAALAGFLKSTGLAKEQLTVQSDPKKGDSYVALIERSGRPTPEVLAEIIPAVIRGFPWPKSMRWGAASAQSGSLRWVRPLQSILCTFDTEIEAPEIVPFTVEGIASGDTTRGHRFMAPGEIRVRRFEDYVAALEGAKVVLDPARRRDIILHDARDLAFAQGFELVEDEALLDEVAGLVEWPVVLMGAFDESFLIIPPEAIRATIRANQKCFVLQSPNGSLANRFVLTANIAAHDGGDAIVAGNERVVRARLSDAKFFWESDLKVPLADRLEKLRSIVFHEKLGTQFERVERIVKLAEWFSDRIEEQKNVGAYLDGGLKATYTNYARQAAYLAKADLVTEMVGEFPELQGLMGRYYATAQGEDASVAAAIEDHYKPVGPSDSVPTDLVSVAVALADKLDTLVGFWAIDEKPTGSKDPYALRRAALGVIRLVLENGLRISLLKAADFSMSRGVLAATMEERSRRRSIAANLVAFFHDRLKTYLRDRGARHDLIDAVLGAGRPSRRAEERPAVASRGTHPGLKPEGTTEDRASFETQASPAPQDDDGGGMAGAVNDDLLMVVRRIEALGRFIETEDGRNLVAATKRAANILRIEEKKDSRTYAGIPDGAALVQPEERALAEALASASRVAADAIGREDFKAAMRALAELRPVVDLFFEAVTVNDADPGLRANRLTLLAGLRDATIAVADFAKIEG